MGESGSYTSLQCQYLTREIYNRASVEVVGTLHKDSHIAMQYQQHYHSMENTTKYFFLNTTWSVMYTYTFAHSIPVWLCQSQLHCKYPDSNWLAHKIWRPELVALYLCPLLSGSPWCHQCCECETPYVHCFHSWQSHVHHSCSCYLQHSCMLSEPCQHR